jgi:hypothetical protein
MATLLRLLLTAGLIYGMVQVNQTPLDGAGAGGLTGTVWMGLTLALAVAAALAWAPVVVGRLVTNPLTDPLAAGSDPEHRPWRLIRWCHARGHHRAVRWLCFVAGVRRPWLPTPFVFGLVNSVPGSLLERLFAAEVLRSKTAFDSSESRELLQALAGEANPRRSPAVGRVLNALALAPDPNAPMSVLRARRRPAADETEKG